MKNKSLNWWEKVHKEASELSRWIALYEAVNTIADKAEEKNISFDEVELKPIAIHKYMDSTENNILKNVLKQIYKIDVCYNEDAPKEYLEILPEPKKEYTVY
jgi:hypothetical protein